MLISYFENSNMFKNKKLQIILTSNAPFVISDLPRRNVILLNKEDGLCKEYDSDGINETFGANIHNLLTKSFFMDSTIGAFANKKIKDAAKDIHEFGNGMPSDRREEVEYVINNIGEPLIKRKLQQMLNGNDYEKRVASLENEVVNLKKALQNKKSNDD